MDAHGPKVPRVLGAGAEQLQLGTLHPVGSRVPDACGLVSRLLWRLARILVPASEFFQLPPRRNRGTNSCRRMALREQPSVGAFAAVFGLQHRQGTKNYIHKRVKKNFANL